MRLRFTLFKAKLFTVWSVPWQVKQVISLGRTDTVQCIVVQHTFYDKTPNGSTEVHAILHKLKKGKSQSQKIKNKNVRVTYIYQSPSGEQLETVITGKKV